MSLPASAVAFMASQVERVRRLPQKKRIVFPEGGDPRVQAAAESLVREELVTPILVGAKPASASGGITFVDPATSASFQKYAGILFERRRSRGMTQSEAAELTRRPLYFAALMVEAGDADGSVGGAANSTADTVRAALHCIGTPPATRTVSSFFVIALENRDVGECGVLFVSDPAIVIDPTAMQLADIALATAHNIGSLLQVEPTVAMLSFSTRGSGGTHKEVEKVREALRIARARNPELHIDGEMQADAALSPAVGRSKMPGSTVAGKANTLIFPNLAACNIGCKLIERLCGAATIGPFLQGLAKPANDLSRGCRAEDIHNNAVITALQAEGMRQSRH